MIEFSWTIFIIGVVLGVIQLAIGYIVGQTAQRRHVAYKPASSKPTKVASKKTGVAPEPLGLDQLQSFAQRLLRLINNVSSDVGQHQVRIEQMTKDLSSLKNQHPSAMASYVLERVGQIVDANRQLQGRLTRVEGKIRQQSEQIAVHVTEARTDPLTRLANRRAFDDELAQRLAAWQRNGVGFALLMIDLDDFKPLNDNHGHLAGDELLQTLSATIDDQLGPTDLAARIGGDEFAAILGEPDLERVCRKAGKILDAVATIRYALDGTIVRTSVSIGAARIEKNEDGASLIRRADKALYAAKNAGKGKAFYHDGERCLPIRHDDATSASSSPTEEEDAAALHELCEDVRSRLDEVLRPSDADDDSPSPLPLGEGGGAAAG
ncbi:MAG: diguanylate cyclase [Pirellulales bacterium]|nr:diguanylate cyclase [Pirellulales bacterium]